MTYSLLVAAFLMGLLGSPHCLGMCGGLVTAFGLSMQTVSPSKKGRLIATYHIGRLSSYMLLGIIASLIGVTVLQPFMQGNSTPRILLGLVLLFVGVSMLGLPLLAKIEVFGMRFWQKLSPLRQKVFPLTTYPKALAAGLLWGFLPCGLVYGALMMAVVGHNVPTGALLMLAFGLGTIPMLVATHGAVNWMRTRITRFRLRQLNGAVMVLSGLAVIALPIVMSNLGLHSGHGAMQHGAHGGMDMTGVSTDIDLHDMNHTHSPSAGANPTQMNMHPESMSNVPMNSVPINSVPREPDSIDTGSVDDSSHVHDMNDMHGAHHSE